MSKGLSTSVCPTVQVSLASSRQSASQDIQELLESLVTGERLSREHMDDLLVALCSERPLKCQELARLVRRSAGYLRDAYLSRLAREGRLQLTGSPSDPNVAYSSASDLSAMELRETRLKQFGKPSGWRGTFAGMRMNLGHAKLWRWALDHITIQPDATILDVGCGGGKAVQIMAQAASDGKACGVDHSQEMVRLAQIVNQALVKEGRVKIECATVSSLPFPDDTFDLATAFESYYFWPNLVDDLREIRRVLKPCGTLLIANEVYKHEGFDEQKADWVGLAGILHLQDPDECRATLAEAGYTAIEIDDASKRNWIAAVVRKPSAAAGHCL